MGGLLLALCSHTAGPVPQGQETGASLQVAVAGMGAALGYKDTLLAIVVGETRQDSSQDP